MSTRKIIAFSSSQNPGRVDVELPGNVPLQELLPDLMKTLFNTVGPEDLKNVSMSNEEGDLLDLKKSLDKNGILNSETISVDTGISTLTIPTIRQSQGARSIRENGDRRNTSEFIVENEVSRPITELAKDRRGHLRRVGRQEIKVEQPCLIYDADDQGFIFVLGNAVSSIGRPKGDYKPNIDLSEIDLEKVSSRPHAEIEKKGNTYILRALKTTNEMFVNGAEIASDETRALKDKDVLQFGFQGVKLVFRLPKPSQK